MPDPLRSEVIVAKTEPRAAHGMIAADHPAATDAGLAVLREGGNAVDAAVTAAFTMAVAEPALSGVGGVAVMVIRLPDGRETVIDGSGLAPRAATPDMFRFAEGASVKGMYGWPAVVGDENNVGYRSTGVPGMVAAMAMALGKYGTIDLARAVRPAVELARHGQAIDFHLTLTFAQYADRLAAFPESKRLFLKENGLPPRPPTALEGGGDVLVLSDLAQTLEAIGRDGPRALYGGDLARAIVEDVQRGGGVLTLEDLASYSARELPALVTDHRGYRVAMNPECGGGITATEMLNILADDDLAKHDPAGPQYIHLVAEACRLAFADRFALLGDPAFVDAPFERVASREHARELRARIAPDRIAATEPVRPTADVPHTTNLCVMDGKGTSVALTSTLGGAFGSAAVIRGTGILLANVMTWFDPRPGRPASIAGGKRILWAPSPAVVSRSGEPWLAVGGAGGRRLISGVARAILSAVHHGTGPQDAVNGPHVHDEGNGTLVDVRVPVATREALTRIGHRVVPTEETQASASFGRYTAVKADREGLRGGVSRMRQGTAAGY